MARHVRVRFLLMQPSKISTDPPTPVSQPLAPVHLSFTSIFGLASLLLPALSVSPMPPSALLIVAHGYIRRRR